MLRSKYLVGFLIVSAGCAAGAPEDVASTRQPDRYTPDENPSILIPGAPTLLSAVIGAADVGRTFGVAEDRVPYPDTYWPFTDDGIDARWNGAQTNSPLEKWMAVTKPANAAAAKKWEHDNHGAGVPGVSGWWGHCPGWTAASISNAPIRHAVYAMSDGEGGIKGCRPMSGPDGGTADAGGADGGSDGGSDGAVADADAASDGAVADAADAAADAGDMGCTKFEIGDINALMAEMYLDADAAFIGARCDTKVADIKRDSYGRIERTGNGEGCKGLNAGALLVVLSQALKVDHHPIAIDAQNDYNTDQIWNQPAYNYTVHRYQALTVNEAANLVARGALTGPETTYRWDLAAKGFARVDISIAWVGENGPNTDVVSGRESTRSMRFAAVIELDAPPSDPAAQIIGGEYLDDPTIGADRLTVPPFVWMARGPGPDNVPAWATGNSHNPYIKPSVVAALVRLGQAQN